MKKRIVRITGAAVRMVRQHGRELVSWGWIGDSW